MPEATTGDRQTTKGRDDGGGSAPAYSPPTPTDTPSSAQDPLEKYIAIFSRTAG